MKLNAGSLIALAALTMALTGRAMPVARAAPIEQAAPDCTFEAAKMASPAVLLLGETTTVELSVSASCIRQDGPLHVVFVLDGSGSMKLGGRDALVAAVTRTITGLDLPANPMTQVAIVEFNTTAKALCRLTNNEVKVLGCVMQLGMGGGTNIGQGIVEAMLVLARGRQILPAGVVARELIIVVADGKNSGGCDPVIAASRRAAGSEVGFVCYGPDCDRPCLLTAAGGEHRLADAGDEAELVAAFDRFIRDGPRAFRQLRIVDGIPANMTLVAGSVAPPATVSPDGRTLTWEARDLPDAGITVRFDVRPTQPGFHATNTAATAEIVDALGGAVRLAFPVPHVSVFGGGPNPIR